MSSVPIPVVLQSTLGIDDNIDDIRIKSDKVICELSVDFADIKQISVNYFIKCVNPNAAATELINTRKHGNAIVIELLNSFLPSDVTIALQLRIPITNVPSLDVSINRGTLIFHGPGTLSTLDILMNIGSCSINSLNAAKLVIKNNMGNIDVINSSFKSLSIKCDAGDVSVWKSQAIDLTVVTHASSQKILACAVENDIILRSDLGMITADCKCTKNSNVIIKNSAGSINAKLLDYKSLDARTDLGQVTMELFPTIETVNRISSDAGTATVKITNFNGNFDCKSSIGPVKVEGPILLTSQAGGIIGGQKLGTIGVGNGSLVVKTSVGTVSVSFLQ